MDPYVFKRNNEGIHIINLGKTWEKLMLAARVIAAIPNPRDVLVRIPSSIKRINMAFLHLTLIEGKMRSAAAYRSFQAENTLKELSLSSPLTLKPTI